MDVNIVDIDLIKMCFLSASKKNIDALERLINLGVDKNCTDISETNALYQFN